MGKPKVPNGVRLSVLIPAEDLKRLKIECIERGMLESTIVLEALRERWRVQKNKQLPPYESLDRGSQAIVQIMRGVGMDPYAENASE